MQLIGLDAGSVSVKLVVFNGKGEIQSTLYRRHKGRPLHVALEVLNDTSRVTRHASLSLTGSAGRLIGMVFGITPVNEVVAYGYATRKLYPHIRTIIELGGEDSKLIILGEDSYSTRDFYMNSVCAAGTGSFLDQQAERLRLSIEEFSELSLKSGKPPRIAGRCSVFAKSDMIHLQQIATPVQDIAAGLCFAVARNFKGSIARGRELDYPVSFQGGVAANRGMIRAFREVFGMPELFVPEEFAVMGAIGAVLKDMDDSRKSGVESQESEKQPAGRGAQNASNFDLQKLEDFINSAKSSEKGYSPLITVTDSFSERHLKGCNALRAMRNELKGEDGPEPDRSQITDHGSRITAFLGVDIGSISTNLALIDKSCNVIAKRYLMTAGRPIEAVRQGLEEICLEIGDRVEIAGVGTTGSGRYMIADYIGADIVKNEITAQATAAAFIDRDVDTIFEIGGQDSKYISLRDGVIVDFEMNKACAAGTGSFLEEQAEKLGISIKGEFQDSAFESGNPCRLGERCTVFMENSLMSNLQSGTDKKDLLAGLAYSIVQNYINRVVCKRRIGSRIFFQGGVAFNKSVVAAFEKYLDREIIVPPHHDVTGAIGMALIAKRHMEDRRSEVEGHRSTVEDRGGATPQITVHGSRISAFKGFEFSRRPYEISSFECKGCPNVCEINRIRIEGEKGNLFYGGRCEKYDVRKKKPEHDIPDLFAFRNEMLWKAHNNYSEALSATRNESDAQNSSRITRHSSRGRIGIPYIFYMHDYLPFWTTLLWELGFEVEVSPVTDRHIIDSGLETVLAETCFPVKTAHGHVKYLLEKGADTLLIPSFVNMNKADDLFSTGFACPYTQTIPYLTKTAFPEMKTLTPVVDLTRGDAFLEKELKRVFKSYGLGKREISGAFKAAQREHENFTEAIKNKGREIISSIGKPAVVIVGRAYNSFDKGVNLDIPRKLADLGVLSMPMDFLEIETSAVKQDWPNMYWRAGQRILSAAKFIRSHPLLHAVYIGNFSCGPDSFIIKYFEEEMAGKPWLHLELDAHSADAGAITRCEAFLDSIGHFKKEMSTPEIRTGRRKTGQFSKERTIFIPRMSDHSLALAGAFEYCGVAAEVLPESSGETVDIGKKYVSGKECYPCAVTTGDMIKKIMEPGFDPDRSAFFMPSGAGPCRFGQYNVFHRLVIKDLKLENIPVFSPNQDENFYEHLRIAGKDFAMRSWKGITAIGLLQKCLHQTRPYEKEKNTAARVYAEHLKRAYDSIRGADGDLNAVLANAKNAFKNIPRQPGKKPLVGIVGEIFVRSNRFSNEDLVRKIEELGGEAYLAPTEEWLYYINFMGLRKVLIKKDWSGMITLLSNRFFQKRIEHKFERHFQGFLKHLHEPDTREIMDKAGPYIHSSFEGEAILSIGKSIELIEKGASGIVNAMPFGCMPGTIVTGLMRGLRREYGIPCLSIPYDGTESLTTEIQLEAFMDQAREYKKK
jgi:predicted CoA-substrate-specific enzyme activase